MKKKILIDGDWRETSEHLDVIAPYDGEVLAEVCFANVSEIEWAIASADSASKKMRSLSRHRIAEGLRKIALGIDERKTEFAETIAKEAAKPIRFARTEVDRGVSTFNWAASEAERFCGNIVPIDAQPGGNGRTAWTKRVPRGVVYGITPFNFPLNLVAHKVAPALASGNSIIIKPSEKTPLTSLLLGEVFLQCGLPQAALQVVPMDIRHMETVLGDGRVKMISFTGSDKVGWLLKQKAGRKAIALELGGNAPAIIDESANIERAVDQTAVGAFAYSGQTCISVQRVLLHEKIADEFTEKFVEKAQSFRHGDPLDEVTQLSVMIDESAAIRAMSWVDEAVEGGAKLLCGGKRNGSMLDATILMDTDPEMKIVSEEVFAPIVVIENFSDFCEGVEIANHSQYGLQAGVFTGSLENASFATENLEYGGVIINDTPTFRVDNMPYGGVKNSGFGREGVKYAMQEMSELKLVVVNL